MSESEEVKELQYFWRKPEKLRLTKEVVWMCPRPYFGKWVSKDGFLTIIGSRWTFKPGFTWNGCTGVTSGPPVTDTDLPVESLTDQPVYELWFASMIHDSVYRYLLEEKYPFDKNDGDRWFKMICKEANWKWAKVYYYGVTVLGWIGIVPRYIKSKLA